MNNATMGAAVLGGYLLGRTKKAKLALGLGALLAGSQVRPGQLGKALDAPFLSDLTRQMRAELAGAGKAAATSVLSSKADNLAGALHERTAGLRERAEGNGTHDDDAEGGTEDETDGGTEDEARAETETETETEKTGGSGSGSGRSRAPQSRSTARPKKKTAAASRAKSGSGTRSRRQDDG
ncbi:ABC transporter substrate-binding protein [Streptomyces sp. MB09-02B]|uniref:ABC transporter substrate-binding protein n=1 Tax=Streptomyces sp. MB09-02B TaxID=3028667 RepID=UPI0029BD7EBB|nr:ABC transporter substrate-binding protein [Streptomyces sp. MB09-02B]MDX3638871.1 ABC transporter substrate-binding protein [Streptomyces sp. MB09-02B]